MPLNPIQLPSLAPQFNEFVPNSEGRLATSKSLNTLQAVSDPSGAFAISESDSNTLVIEGGASDSYTIALSRLPSSTVTVIATADSETTVAPVTLTFTSANYNTPQNVVVTAVNDTIAEGRESSFITIRANSTDTSYNGVTATLTATVIDNDTPAGITITPSNGGTAVTEGGAGGSETDTYTLALNRYPTTDVVIAIAPDPQTLTEPATLTFTPNNFDTPQTISLRAFDDNQIEGNHLSTIRHTIVSGDAAYTTTLSIPSVTATVYDNDTPSQNPPILEPEAPLPDPTIPPQGTPNPDVIFGTENQDDIQGLAGNDQIYALGGSDTLQGGKGNDQIYGGTGRDLIDGDRGSDHLAGGKDNDTLNGGNSIDALFGNQGNDFLQGGEDDDNLYGGQDDDILDGGNGNDVLTGDFGRDLLIGGTGNDLFMLRTTTAVNNLSFADFIQDFEVGRDVIGLTSGLTPADLALEQSGKDTIIRIRSTNQILGVVAEVTPQLLSGSFIPVNIGLP